MKKTFLVILVIAAVAFSAFADGLHYGIESDISYEFNFTNDPALEGSNEATFKFKPYVYSDFFTVRLLAEWKPNDNNAHGFDYLMEFDTTDIYTTTASILKYIDTVEIKTDMIEFAVGKGSRDFDIHYVGKDRYENRAQLKADFGLVKLDLYSTDFDLHPYSNRYNSVQYADVKVNLGLVEAEASVMRQGVFLNGGFFAYNRIIPKVGAKLQFGLANVGFYLTTDTARKLDDSILIKLFDRWLLEAVAQFKVGTFDIKGTFYLDNRLEGYSNLFFHNDPLFGFRANADIALGEFMTLNLSGDLPLSLKEGLHVIRNTDNVTQEKFSASIDFGTWWRVGADITLKGLISEIESGDDFLTFVENAEPTIRAGIYTVPLDVTASVKISSNTHGFIPEVTIGAVIRGDNFLSQTK